MKEKEISEFTDQELLAESKKLRTSPIENGLLIGFLIGILIYSILVSSIGFLSLIPLFFIFMFINQSKKNDEVDKLIKERNLK